MRWEVLGILAVCTTLSGCGTGAPRYDPVAAARAAKDQALRQCDERFPDGKGKTLAKAKCQYDAAMLMRPYVPYPDLFDAEMTFYVATAEKVQNGKMTLAEADQAYAEYRSRTVSEEQRRNLAGRSVAAQESIAAAASAPPPSITCTRVGPNTLCN